jgi:hypothetical protein
LLLLVCLALPVRAEESRSLTPIEQVEVLIGLGLLDDAKDVLAKFLEEHPRDIEGRFLQATIFVEEKRWPDAIAVYRAILDEDPDLLRVRLDYARALFENGEDEEADYNFRLVLPQVPKEVAGNIYVFLGEINARKRFTYSLSLGGGPDTNINAAPSISQLTLFGLPFTLPQGSRETFGVGMVMTGSGEYRLPLTDAPLLADSPGQPRLRLGGLFYRAEYFGGHSKFDDMIARVYAGPQLLLDRGDISLLGVASERWYGNLPYNWGFGPRVELNRSLGDRILIQAGIEYTPDWYHSQTFLNGHLLTGLVTTQYVLSTVSSVSLITGVSKEHDASPDFSNLAYRVGFGYQRELPFGISTYVQPDLLLADYVAPSPTFGTTRRDRLVRLQLTVLKRDIRLWGAVPSITYNFADNISNQDLFAYTRHQFILGISRSF